MNGGAFEIQDRGSTFLLITGLSDEVKVAEAIELI